MSSGLGVETAAAAMVVVWGCGDERTDDKRRPTKVCPPWQRKRGAPGSGTRASPCGRVLIPFTRSHSRGHRIYVGFDNKNKYTRHLLATWDFRAHMRTKWSKIPHWIFPSGRSVEAGQRCCMSAQVWALLVARALCQLSPSAHGPWPPRHSVNSAHSPTLCVYTSSSPS